MNVTIRGQHMEVTPAIYDHVIEQLERIKRHFDHPILVSVVLSVEKLIQQAEAIVHVDGRDLHSRVTHLDLYKAIDEMAHALDRQILRIKEKKSTHRTDERIRDHLEPI